MAAVDDPGRLPTTRSASASSTSAPTTPGTVRSCCTAPCSARSSGSSACCSSTTPGRSRRGWRRCRCGCCPWPRRTRSTPPRSSTALRRRRMRASTSAIADDGLGKRIRNAKLEKIPYVLVVGDDDVAAHTVGVNPRGGEVERGVAVDAVRRADLRAEVADAETRGARRLIDRCSNESGRAGGRPTSPASAVDARAAFDSGAGVRRACSPSCCSRGCPTTRRTSSIADDLLRDHATLFPYASGHLLVAAVPRGGRPRRPDAGGDGRAVGDGHRRPFAVVRQRLPARRAQRRPQPRPSLPAGRCRRTCTSTWCRAGPATPTSWRRSPTPRRSRRALVDVGARRLRRMARCRAAS